MREHLGEHQTPKLQGREQSVRWTLSKRTLTLGVPGGVRIPREDTDELARLRTLHITIGALNEGGGRIAPVIVR